MIQGLNEQARDELENLRLESGGYLIPQDIVERARSENSALHKYFEWDDSEAAEAYRLHQARSVIRAVVQYIPRSNGDAVRVRAYVSLPSDRVKNNGYRSVAEVMTDEESFIEASRDLTREIARLREKYSAWRRLQPALDALDKVMRQFDLSGV